MIGKGLNMGSSGFQRPVPSSAQQLGESAPESLAEEGIEWKGQPTTHDNGTLTRAFPTWEILLKRAIPSPAEAAHENRLLMKIACS